MFSVMEKNLMVIDFNFIKTIEKENEYKQKEIEPLLMTN